MIAHATTAPPLSSVRTIARPTTGESCGSVRVKPAGGEREGCRGASGTQQCRLRPGVAAGSASRPPIAGGGAGGDGGMGWGVGCAARGEGADALGRSGATGQVHVDVDGAVRVGGQGRRRRVRQSEFGVVAPKSRVHRRFDGRARGQAGEQAHANEARALGLHEQRAADVDEAGIRSRGLGKDCPMRRPGRVNSRKPQNPLVQGLSSRSVYPARRARSQ